MLDATEGSAGEGPYSVETSEDDGFHYITLHGLALAKGYPLRKTALRRCRELNATGAALGDLGAFGTGVVKVASDGEVTHVPVEDWTAPAAADPGAPETFPTAEELEAAQGQHFT